MSRLTLIRGPGAVKFGDVVLHDADGIQADIQVAASPVSTSIEGEVDQWINSRFGTISFRPAGEATAAILAALYPHQTPVIGASLLGAVDVPLVVASKAGVKVTYHAAALMQPPQLRLSATQTAFGSAAQFRALLAAGKAPGDEDALVSIESEAWSDATYPFAATNLLRGAYLGTYDGATITPRGGWTIDVQLATQAVQVDHEGEIDILLTGVTVAAKCEPQGMTEAALAALLPYTAANGESIRAGNDLVISAGAGKIAVTLHDARPLVGPMRWGTVALRSGEVAWIAQRKLTAGVPGALYSVGIAQA